MSCPERGYGIARRLKSTGRIQSKACRPVQRNATRAFRGERSFLAFLKAEPEVSAAISSAELDALSDTRLHLRNAGTIFERVFDAK